MFFEVYDTDSPAGGSLAVSRVEVRNICIPDLSFSNVVVPVLFALAATFYAKLGYMAFFGCSDKHHVDRVLKEFESKLSNLETDFNSENIDRKLTDLAEKVTALQDKIIDIEKTYKERIDLIEQLDGVTAGGVKKASSTKNTITTVLLLVLLVLQICFIFGARRVYQRTKEMEKEIAKLKAKQ